MSTEGVVAFYEERVLPVLLDDPRGAFPEFDFQDRHNGWAAGRRADPGLADRFGCRVDRIVLSTRRPGVLFAGGRTVQLTAYVLGRDQPPRGADFVKAVSEIAGRLGIDTSPIDGRELTADDRRRIEAEQAQRAREAKERREAAELEHKRVLELKVRNARELIARAQDFIAKNGPELAHAYFKHRGGDLSAAPGVVVGETLLVVGDVFTPGRTQHALVVPLFRGDEALPVAAHRLFIDPRGRPMEVVVDQQTGKATRKAVLGDMTTPGAHALIEAQNATGTVCVTEGYETGVAVAAATGCAVLPAVSAWGMENIDVHRSVLDDAQRFVFAGDLDRSGTGQAAAAAGVERVRRAYSLPAIAALPSAVLAPTLVGGDAMPIKGKSVDWEDVVGEVGADDVGMAIDAIGHGAYAEPQPAGDAPASSRRDSGPAERPAPLATMMTEPTHVLAPSDLGRAHQFLRDRFTRPGHESVSLLAHGGELHMYQDGRWRTLGDYNVIRGEIRRWSAPYYIHKQASRNDAESDVWKLANLSKTSINGILEAVIDEALVLTPLDDFRPTFWLEPNVGDDGLVRTDRPTWSRRVEDPEAEGLPDPALVLSVSNGLIDLRAWRDRGEFRVLEHTPTFFSTSKLDLLLPVEEIRAALAREGGLEALRELGRSMCPLWCQSFEGRFHEDEYPESAAQHHREYMKFVGNCFTDDLEYQSGNIAMLHGSGGTGKSTDIKVVMALLGMREVVSSSLFKLKNGFHLWSWVRKRLAVFSDLEQVSGPDKGHVVELLKQIATGDEVSVDRKHRDEIPSIQLKTRQLWAVNTVPRFPDATSAMVRRIIAFDYKRPVPDDMKDPYLLDKLTAPESLVGICILALCGLRDLKLDGGFRQPERSAQPLELLASQGSVYPEFVEHCIEVDNDWTLYGESGGFEGAYTPSADIHDAFCGWLKDTGYDHYSKSPAGFWADLLPVLDTETNWKREGSKRLTIDGDKQPYGYCGLKLTRTGEQMRDKHREVEGYEAGGGGGGRAEPDSGFLAEIGG